MGACCVSLLVKPDTARAQRCALSPANRGGVPIAAREEEHPVFLHGIHQHQVASAVQLHDKHSVVAQRLAYGARRTVDEATLFVEVACQTHLDTWTGKYPQGRLRRGVA